MSDSGETIYYHYRPAGCFWPRELAARLLATVKPVVTMNEPA
jgi:hypothetical protein